MKSNLLKLTLSTPSSVGDVVTSLYETRDPVAMGKVTTELRRIIAKAPKLRAATYGNRRPVKVIALDTDKTATLLRSQTIQRAFHVGHVWPSACDASAALGLSRNTLRQTFAQAKKANGGIACAVILRGHTLDYNDTRDHAEA